MEWDVYLPILRSRGGCLFPAVVAGFCYGLPGTRCVMGCLFMRFLGFLGQVVRSDTIPSVSILMVFQKMGISSVSASYYWVEHGSMFEKLLFIFLFHLFILLANQSLYYGSVWGEWRKWHVNYSNLRRNRFIGGYVHNGVVFQYVSDSTFVWCSTLYVVYNIFNTSVTTPVIPPNVLFHSSFSSHYYYFKINTTLNLLK